ncbi:MAG: glycosyltransferase [Verrucomicrobiota bacterium]|nr:glycosyltransferase [Verrucomicrobiota bacterium]
MSQGIGAWEKENFVGAFRNEDRTVFDRVAQLLIGRKSAAAFRRGQELRDQFASAPKDELSVVIGSYNRCKLLQGAIASVRAQGIRLPYEIIVIDGGSTDDTCQWLLAERDILTIVQHNRGECNSRRIQRKSWGYFMNLGFKVARGKYILMLSDDCLLLPEAVNRAIEQLDKLQAEGRRIGGAAFYFRNWPSETEYYVQKTLGGNLMVNHGIFVRNALEAVGWIEEERYAFYKADSDLCLKLWHAGYEIVDCPGAFVEHYVDAAEPLRQSNDAVHARDRKAYLSRWRGIYLQPGKPHHIGRVTIRYDDPSATADRFRELLKPQTVSA